MTADQLLIYGLSSFACGYTAGWLIYAWKRAMEIASS